MIIYFDEIILWFIIVLVIILYNLFLVNEYIFKKSMCSDYRINILKKFYKINELIYVVLINVYKLVIVFLDFL